MVTCYWFNDFIVSSQLFFCFQIFANLLFNFGYVWCVCTKSIQATMFQIDLNWKEKQIKIERERVERQNKVDTNGMFRICHSTKCKATITIGYSNWTLKTQASTDHLIVFVYSIGASLGRRFHPELLYFFFLFVTLFERTQITNYGHNHCYSSTI